MYLVTASIINLPALGFKIVYSKNTKHISFQVVFCLSRLLLPGFRNAAVADPETS